MVNVKKYECGGEVEETKKLCPHLVNETKPGDPPQIRVGFMVPKIFPTNHSDNGSRTAIVKAQNG